MIILNAWLRYVVLLVRRKVDGLADFLQGDTAMISGERMKSRTRPARGLLEPSQPISAIKRWHFKRIFHLMAAVVILITGTTMLTLAQDSGGEVLVLSVDGPVSPVMLSYITRGIEAGEVQQAEAIVLQLDTPGGQVDLMREIVQVIVNAKVPVVVYVSPAGAFAASAGTFITLAGHSAAMAPNTSIGAASPIDAQGSDINETARAKVENILLADLENLAERRGERALEWAKRTVTHAEAASANEALEIGAIDYIATDIDDLLAQLDGQMVDINGKTHTFNTAQATTRPFEMTAIEQFLSIFLNPEIAFMLISIGSLAIVYELASPGGFVSGVIGLICVVLGLYALGQLPINYAGLGLIVLAFILFAAELITPTYGALTMAGVISLFIGGLLLFDTTEFNYRLSIWPLAGVSLSLGAIFFFAMGKAVAAMRRAPVAGRERLIGAVGVAKTALSPSGMVMVDGSRWQATLEAADTAIERGDAIEVVSMEGFRLTVRKKASG